MKVIARSLVVIFVALIAVPALAVTYTLTTAVQLLATTALIMGGTGHPLSLPTDSNDFVDMYMDQAVDNYIDPGGAGPVEKRVAVIYPAQFFPVSGSTTFDDSVADGRANLNGCLGNGTQGCDFNPAFDEPDPVEDTFIVFGYSQSAVIASLVKQDLMTTNPPGPEGGPDTAEFFVAANPMRPNGGILARGFEGLTIPFVGITFYGPTQNSCPSADPCAGPYPTTDVAQQYDLLGGDAPAVPWNVLAWANSAAAYGLLHGAVPSRTIDGSDPTVINQGQYGDTTYYMITAPRLPLLMLPEMLGVPGPLLAVVDAPLRVLVEAGHYRQPSPGEHVQFQLLPETDAITLVANLIVSIPVGIDDGLQEAGLGRALGTDDVYRPFGVGGQAYDKVTGLPVDDESAPLNALNAEALNVAAAPDPKPPVALAQTGDTSEINPTPEVNRTTEGTELEDETPEGNTPLEGTKPRPLRDVLRLPIQFGQPDRPAARQTGDGPLKRAINALTGQRPDPTPESADEDKADEAAENEPDEGAEPAA